MHSGPEAQELLKQLKHNSPHTSLIEFTRLHPHFTTQSGYASVLSTQSHAVGQSVVNTLLVQHTEADTHLTAQQVSTLHNIIDVGAQSNSCCVCDCLPTPYLCGVHTSWVCLQGRRLPAAAG